MKDIDNLNRVQRHIKMKGQLNHKINKQYTCCPHNQMCQMDGYTKELGWISKVITLSFERMMELCAHINFMFQRVGAVTEKALMKSCGIE